MAKDTPSKSSKSKADKLTKAEKQALKTLIRNRIGVTAAQINALIDENDNTLDAEKIESSIRDWLQQRPKA